MDRSAVASPRAGIRALHKTEALVAQRGCVGAIIETLGVDIAQWYQRAGYVAIAQVPVHCGPWSRHTLLKPLTCYQRNGIGKTIQDDA